MGKDSASLKRLRKLISALPETSEKLSHGSPTFWGGKKTFASFHDNHHGDGRVAAWIKSNHEAQEDLVAAFPDAIYIPPYVGPSGWIGVVLGKETDWSLVEGLLEEGYRMVAPRRAVAQLDADRAS
jgi:hypothetical protein